MESDLDHEVGPDPDPKSGIELDLEPLAPVVFDHDPDPKRLGKEAPIRWKWRTR